MLCYEHDPPVYPHRVFDGFHIVIHQWGFSDVDTIQPENFTRWIAEAGNPVPGNCGIPGCHNMRDLPIRSAILVLKTRDAIKRKPHYGYFNLAIYQSWVVY